MNDTTTQGKTEPCLLDLAGGQKLLVDRTSEGNLLQFLSPGGLVTLTVEVTPSGPVIRFDGGLKIQASGPLELDAARVAIRGAEGVSIESGGDARIAAAGDLDSEARVQNIWARLGNVNLKANDDVKLKGERIRLNC